MFIVRHAAGSGDATRSFGSTTRRAFGFAGVFRTRFERRASRTPSLRGIRTLEVVREMEPLLADFGAWDADPELVGTPDQRVLDLRNGEIRAATPDDRISRRLGFVPDTSREAARWLRFLDETVPVDDKAESVAFLQRWCGYTLTGYNREHKFLFLLGSGGNGKGTFRDVLAAVMGEYYRGLPTDAIFGRYPQHRQWMARLEGARCASVSEPSPEDRWRVGDLKDLTGGGKVTANFMRQDSIDFEPICKLVVLANDAPKLGSVDEAIRRRLTLNAIHAHASNDRSEAVRSTADRGAGHPRVDGRGRGGLLA